MTYEYELSRISRKIGILKNELGLIIDENLDISDDPSIIKGKDVYILLEEAEEILDKLLQ